MGVFVCSGVTGVVKVLPHAAVKRGRVLVPGGTGGTLKLNAAAKKSEISQQSSLKGRPICLRRADGPGADPLGAQIVGAADSTHGCDAALAFSISWLGAAVTFA